MAISGSGTTNLGGSLYSGLTSVSNIDSLATQTGKFRTEYNSSELAGVTPEMAVNIAAGIDTYISNVGDAMNSLNDLALTGGLKGSKVEISAKNFISKVVTLCNNLVTELTAAEKDIVTKVKDAYAAEEAAIASSMDDDIESAIGSGTEQ